MSTLSPKTEPEWRAQDDARVLKQFIEIKNDKKRLVAARKFLRSEAKLNDSAQKV